MKTYIGVKIVQAEPQFEPHPKPNATAGDGYRVRYADGYESWSPKDVFEEAYVEVQPDEADGLLRRARASIYDDEPSAAEQAIGVRMSAMNFALTFAASTGNPTMETLIGNARQIEKFVTGETGVGSDDLAFLKLQLELAADVLHADNLQRALAIVDWLGTSG